MSAHYAPGTLLSISYVLSHFIKSIADCGLMMQDQIGDACMHQSWDFILQMGKNRNEKIREEAISKTYQLFWTLGVRAERLQVSGRWRHWRRGRLNGDNAKFSFECILLEVLVSSGAQGKVRRGVSSYNQYIRSMIKLIRMDEIR